MCRNGKSTQAQGSGLPTEDTQQVWGPTNNLVPGMVAPWASTLCVQGMHHSSRCEGRGSLGGSAVWRLPSAQGVILESQDQVPHRAPCMEPASRSACVSASLSLARSVSHE